MKHIKPMSTQRAEAFRDLMFAIMRAWYDFRIQKKNEYLI